jgi:valyl-tRNA synthetase
MEKKYDFIKKEKKWGRFWQKEKVYQFSPQEKKEIYSIDTPPPTLSGRMHIGHAFSYTQQDIVARYKRMSGKSIFYPFGTDDNGLATEKLVEKENNVRIFDMQRKDFIKLCQKTIKRLLPDFVQDWKDIGMSCDFDLEYSTITSDVQKISQKYFLDLYKKKRAYRKEGPTVWCPLCQTAIAQAEMEDKEKEGMFYDIPFKVENKEITIATTRPELLSSCVAILIHPTDNRYKKFVGKKATVPLFNYEVEIIADETVEKRKGTGAVMCCTFGDVTDIEWFYAHNLPLRVSVNKDGKFNKTAGKYSGLSIAKAKERIVEDLKKEKRIKKEEKITHTTNIHERCSTPVEIIPTNQWFIKYLDLKKDFLRLGKKLVWTPPHFRTRYENWVKGLKWDWCISRQRYFGIPFPVWYCKHCNKEVVASIRELPVDPFSTKPQKKCCGKRDFIPDKNVLDTWATSGLTPQITQSLVKSKKVKEKLFPMSLRPQSHDIINFWLFYTVARSKLHFNKLPWKETVISGFVLDEKGEKMSKSKGNVVLPQTVIEKYGADALRYWTASVGFGEDIRWSEKEINSAKRTLTKLWNASKFSISHLENYTPKKRLDDKKLEEEDKWILSKFQETIKEYTAHFEKHHYQKARRTLDSFFWNDFCGNYIEMTKSRLYNAERSPEGAKFATYHCLLGIIKLYAPFIPFITEEIYQAYFKNFEKEKSIHLAELPKKKKELSFPTSAKNIEAVVEVITAVRKFKSENNISMGKEIEKLTIQTENKGIIKNTAVLKDTLKVKNIAFGRGDIIVSANLFIKIKN